MNHERNLKLDIERERQRQIQLREGAKNSSASLSVLNSKIEALEAPKKKALAELRDQLRKIKEKCAYRSKELNNLRNKKESIHRDLAILGTEKNFWQAKKQKLQDEIDSMGKLDIDDQKQRRNVLLNAIKREEEKFRVEKLKAIETMRKRFGDNMAKFSVSPHIEYKNGRDDLKLGLQKAREKIQSLPAVIESKRELQALRDQLSHLQNSKISVADLENKYFESRQKAIELRHKSKDRRSEVDRVKEQLHLKQSSYKDIKNSYRKRMDGLHQEIYDLEMQMDRIRSNVYNHSELESEIRKMKKLLKNRTLRVKILKYLKKDFLGFYLLKSFLLVGLLT